MLIICLFIRSGSIMDFLAFSAAGPALLIMRPKLFQRQLSLILFEAPLGIFLNVSYGNHERHTFDVFMPKDAKATNSECLAPVLVFVHGGIWSSGSSLLYRAFGDQMAACGFTTIVLNYRLYPNASALEQSSDLWLALHFLQNKLKEYNGDKRKIFLCGHSSGAHIIALLLYRMFGEAVSNWQENEFLKMPEFNISGFIGIAGVYDIFSHREFERLRGVHQISPMTPANGNMKENLRKYSPALLKVKNTFPPTLLIHGKLDDTVPYQTTIAYSKLLPNVQVILPEADHASIITDVMFEVGNNAEYLSLIKSWIESICLIQSKNCIIESKL